MMLLCAEYCDSESLDITVKLMNSSECYHHVVLAVCSVVHHCLRSDSALFCTAKPPGLEKNDVA